jgi:hypothetical protein
MVSAFDAQRTFQSHVPHAITKMTQVVLFKLPLCLVRYSIIIWVSVILQVPFDITQELVVLGEYYDDRD